MSGKRAFIVDRDNCMECGACMTNCGVGALHVNRGVGCATAIINSMISDANLPTIAEQILKKQALLNRRAKLHPV
jgi:ferredoxin